MKPLSLLAGACLMLGAFAPAASANPALPMDLADVLTPSAPLLPLASPAAEAAAGARLAELLLAPFGLAVRPIRPPSRRDPR